MSGDLRAKKNIRKELSKNTSSGLNKRNREKGGSQFQHDSPGVNHESDDLDQAEDVFLNKKSASEQSEDEEDRAVKIKVKTVAYYYFKLSDLTVQMNIKCISFIKH